MSLMKKENGFPDFHPSQNHQLGINSTVKHSNATDPATSGVKKENPAACVFVASLNKNVEDEELNSSVFNHFKQWGKLLGVKVLKDWLKRPYAFVQFESEKDSQRALQEAPGTLINGRNIRCEPARVNRSICLISFNQPFNKKFLQSSLSSFGELEDITILQPHGKFHYVFIKFKYRDDAIKAYLALKCTDLSSANNNWFVEWASNLDVNNMYGGGGVMGGNIFGRCLDRSSVFIGNLHESTTEIDLRDEFRLYGKILNIHLIHKPTRYRAKRVFAFIKYETEVDAARAIDHENGKLWNEKTLRVCYREYYHNYSASSSPVVANNNSISTIAAAPANNSPQYYYYCYFNPLFNNSKRQQSQIMPSATTAQVPVQAAAAQVVNDGNNNYFIMPYCNPAATTTTATIYDPNSYSYMMANSIPSSAEESSFTNNNMTAPVGNIIRAATTTTINSQVNNFTPSYYPYSTAATAATAATTTASATAATATAMVYYPYPPAATQPYYYSHASCYSKNVNNYGNSDVQYQNTGANYDASSAGKNAVTTA